MEDQSQIDSASETACPYHDFSSDFDPLDLSDPFPLLARARRGKSGGFRVIYYVQLSDLVTLLTIYSKTDDTDISIAEIRQLAMESIH